MALLIENGTVLTGGEKPEVLTGHTLLLEDGLISKIAPQGAFRRFAGRRIDAGGKVVMPGFINAHTHFYSTFARGLTRTKPAADFVGVLKNLWWRLDSALSTEDCYYSALVALLDAIRQGTTTLIDHHASPRAARGSLNAIAGAVGRSGLRACLCYEVSDRDGARIAQEGLEENVDFIRRCRAEGVKARQRGNGEPGPARPVARGGTLGQKAQGPLTSSPTVEGRLAALFGLHAAFTLKDTTLERAAALGHELGAGFHIHVAEAQSDQDFSRREHRLRVVARLNRFGILGPHSIAAHCVHVNRHEMELLGQTRTAVVHNPQSNLNNAVGIADLAALEQSRVLVGLGTDAMTNHMLEEARVALWAQHHRAQNPSVGFGQVVSALFVNNPRLASRIFNLPLGTVRAGAAADLVILDYLPPTPLEAANAFGHLIFGLSQATVETTIVAGRVLMHHRRLALDLDEERINARARELAAKLWQRL